MYSFPDFVQLYVFSYSSLSSFKRVILNSNKELVTRVLFLFFCWCYVSLIPHNSCNLALVSIPFKEESLFESF